MTPRPRIDWVEAFHYFVTLGPPRTYAAVADRYGVTEGAVRRQAKMGDWNPRARELDARALKQAEVKLTRSRAERIASTLQLVDAAVEQLLEEHRAGRLEARLSDIPALVKLAELLEGEPTERVHVSEVERVFVVFLQRFDDLAGRVLEGVPARTREPVVERLRREVPQLIEETVASIEASGS